MINILLVSGIIALICIAISQVIITICKKEKENE
jgi:hypothetical protein